MIPLEWQPSLTSDDLFSERSILSLWSLTHWHRLIRSRKDKFVLLATSTSIFPLSLLSTLGIRFCRKTRLESLRVVFCLWFGNCDEVRASVPLSLSLRYHIITTDADCLATGKLITEELSSNRYLHSIVCDCFFGDIICCLLSICTVQSIASSWTSSIVIPEISEYD